MNTKAGRDQAHKSQTTQPSGVNWLLTIAIDDYDHCAKLNNCVRDAKAITKILTEKYQFQKVEELYDAAANRKNIIAKLNDLQGKIKKDVDNLLIYFSGHGETEGEDGDDDEQIGYLVPVDAARGDESDYFPHSFFKEKLNRIKTRHTFVIMDACFSGSFFIKIKSDKRSGAEHIASRWGFSSSLSHEVALDGTPGDNSPFAQCLLETLEEHNASFGIHGLAEAVGNKMLERSARQTPVCLPFSDPNKYKGQFFFHPTQNEAQEWTAIENNENVAAEVYYNFWQKDSSKQYAEEALWRYACSSNQAADYHLYRKHYPRGKYDNASLEKLDDATFFEANTVNQLRSYLRVFGDDANHADEAHQRINDLLSGIVPKTSPSKIILPEAPKLEIPLEGRVLDIPGFSFIKGGTFEMGDVMEDKEYDNEKPVHTVTVSDFYMGKYAVTFDEYDAFCNATKSSKPSDEKWGRARRPVINVDWYDAVEYCNWRSEQEGWERVYDIEKRLIDPYNQNKATEDAKRWYVQVNWNAKGYRLPTEAEWEYAAREGGRKVRFGNGKDIASPLEINFYAKEDRKKPYSIAGEYRGKTLPVDSFQPNSLDLYDMSGNVWEWCGDWYGETYYAESGNSNNPTGPSAGTYRVVRGGSWLLNPDDCRAANRDGFNPTNRYNDIGFRLVRH